MKIHREGRSILGLFAILFIFISLVFYFYIPFYYNLTLIFLLWIFYGLIVYFFRDPLRETFSKPLEIIAPVDGKIVALEKIFEDEFLKKEVYQLSIFMSPLNVHVSRYPVSGTVEYVKYHKGKYLVAFHPKSSKLNERTTTVVKAENNQQVLFRQIAGAVARRIVIYAKKGDEAKAGHEYGFIKFGSRLDIFLPLDTEFFCKVGDVTKGGVDVLAKLKD
ncbi:phosphatidylserine decarboxylase [Candidatus Ornithobacterium hominis]|uniref:phosphatidylserine decarboxylase family protein n=1 Tax=Candidatus Ornithobacterium hominis TaxID=2497989 RepID=UPI000E5C2782|nr:phosphatidylserine decarboxylase family protein [Candidatus Ornithobacterium hominis]SZD72618.1 phosphatidylserine decarboxylase [Candidatus Ornithobacterium hominis]